VSASAPTCLAVQLDCACFFSLTRALPSFSASATGSSSAVALEVFWSAYQHRWHVSTCSCLLRPRCVESRCFLCQSLCCNDRVTCLALRSRLPDVRLQHVPLQVELVTSRYGVAATSVGLAQCIRHKWTIAYVCTDQMQQALPSCTSLEADLKQRSTGGRQLGGQVSQNVTHDALHRSMCKLAIQQNV